MTTEKHAWSASLRSLIGSAVGTVAMGLANRHIEGSRPAMSSSLAGETRRFATTHGDMVYRVAGPEGAPPLLLLHGIYATSSGWEMRKLHAALSNSYRVYTPDLLGYGESDHPVLAYQAETYVQLLGDFVAGAIGRQTAVIASTLSAAHTVAAAAQRPALFGPLVLIEPVGLTQLARRLEPLNLLAYSLFAAPVLGEFLFNLLASRASIRRFLAQDGYLKPELVTDEVVEAHYAPAHQPNARFAPGAFVAGRLNCDIREAFAELSQPILLVWGYQSRIVPVQQASAFLKTNPRAELVGFDAAGLPHDEQAEAFLSEVGGWLRQQWPLDGSVPAPRRTIKTRSVAPNVRLELGDR